MTYDSTQPLGLNELPSCSKETLHLSISITHSLHFHNLFTEKCQCEGEKLVHTLQMDEKGKKTKKTHTKRTNKNSGGLRGKNVITLCNNHPRIGVRCSCIDEVRVP